MQFKRPNRTEINNLELEILHAHGGSPRTTKSIFSFYYGSTVGFYILKTSQCSAAEDEVLVVQFSSPISSVV